MMEFLYFLLSSFPVTSSWLHHCDNSTIQTTSTTWSHSGWSCTTPKWIPPSIASAAAITTTTTITLWRSKTWIFPTPDNTNASNGIRSSWRWRSFRLRAATSPSLQLQPTGQVLCLRFRSWMPEKLPHFTAAWKQKGEVKNQNLLGNSTINQ